MAPASAVALVAVALVALALTATTTATAATQRTPMTCRDWQLRDEADAMLQAAQRNYSYRSPFKTGLCPLSDARSCGVCNSFDITTCKARPAFQPDDNQTVLYCGECACNKRCTYDFDSTSDWILTFPECKASPTSIITWVDVGFLMEVPAGYDNGGYICGNNVTSCVGRMCPKSKAPCRYPAYYALGDRTPPNNITCPTIWFNFKNTTCADMLNACTWYSGSATRSSPSLLPWGELVNLQVSLLGGSYSCATCSNGKFENTAPGLRILAGSALFSFALAAVCALLMPVLLLGVCCRNRNDTIYYQERLAKRVRGSALMLLTCGAPPKPSGNVMWLAKVLDVHDFGTLVMLHRNPLALSSASASILYGVALSATLEAVFADTCEYNMASIDVRSTTAFIVVTACWYPVAKAFDLALLLTFKKRWARAYTFLLIGIPVFTLIFAVVACISYSQARQSGADGLFSKVFSSLGVGWAVDLARIIVMLKCCGVMPRCSRGVAAHDLDDADGSGGNAQADESGGAGVKSNPSGKLVVAAGSTRADV